MKIFSYMLILVGIGVVTSGVNSYCPDAMPIWIGLCLMKGGANAVKNSK